MNREHRLAGGTGVPKREDAPDEWVEANLDFLGAI
jgi:hypothetical protein